MKSYRQRKSFFRLFNFAHDDIRCTSSRDDRRMFPAFTIIELLVVIAVIAILAAITIVTYIGVTSNARKSTLTANLEQASKALSVYKETTSTDGTYPDSLADAKLSLTSDSNTTYSYHTNSAKTNYCLEGTTQNITKSIAGNNPTVSDSTCVSATNLITNGDFSQGTSGWSTYRLIFSDNPTTFTASSTNSEHYVQELFTPEASHVYYLRAHVIPNFGKVVLYIYNKKSDGSYEPGISSVISSESNLSVRLSVSSTYSTPNGFLRITVLNSSASGVFDSSGELVQPSYCLALDLTAAFGAGKEPTAAQMDAMLQNYPNSWFNGTDFLQKPTQ